VRSRAKSIHNRNERLYVLNVMSAVGAVRGSVLDAAKSSLPKGESGLVQHNYFLLSDYCLRPFESSCQTHWSPPHDYSSGYHPFTGKE